MKNYITTTLFLLFVFIAQAQSDEQLNRDSVLGWNYITTPAKSQVYKPVKDPNSGYLYSVRQQQISDTLAKWIQQSCLPRGIVIRDVVKNDLRWSFGGAPVLHSYGINFLGFEAHFVNGKLNLHCCEKGDLVNVSVNEFPGAYIKGFNPGGLYFFAEQASFSSSEDDAKLSAEDVDKKIQPDLHTYRTYLDHYHNNGQPFNKVGVVIAKNNEWPFKQITVKDIVDYINQQLAAYPGILQKNAYAANSIKAALDRQKPYYNEAAKLKANTNYNTQLDDGSGHTVLHPENIINGLPVSKSFPEYFMLVSCSQQTIDQSKTDKPMWVYFNFAPVSAIKGSLAATDFNDSKSFFSKVLIRNFNFDYIASWLSSPERIKGKAYRPLNEPAQTATGITSSPSKVSTTASIKNKDANTILFEDFDGYQAGTFSAKGWQTYGHNGHDFANATLTEVNGRAGKWISIPPEFTFYPLVTGSLPGNFTVRYDLYFGNTQNKRTANYFRIEIADNKKSIPIDMKDMNRNGFEFSIAQSGEIEYSKRFMIVSENETLGKVTIPAFAPGAIVHITVIVNGAAVSVLVNGNEVVNDANVLPAGKTFKRYGWYCTEQNINLSNIYVKSGTP